MPDWHNYFLMCHDDGLKKCHLKSAHFFIQSYVMVYGCPWTCSVHRISTDSMAELHFLIPVYLFYLIVSPVLINRQNTCNHSWVKTCYKNASSKHVNESCNKYHNCHLFVWTRMPCRCQTESIHDIESMRFVFRRYLTSVWCRYVNPACVYYCSMIKKLNGM